MIDKLWLEQEYLRAGKSMMTIAQENGYSHHKIAYWMSKHKIPRRKISEAIYLRSNPKGDPFTVKPIRTKQDAFLMGLGLGLYWGEGTKASRHSIRLGNTDPELIKAFIRYLTELYGVPKEKFRFSLQIFTDIDPDEAKTYWVEQLRVDPWQFSKITVTISGSIGTYRHKSRYGVLTVHVNNKKLRDIIVGQLPG